MSSISSALSQTPWPKGEMRAEQAQVVEMPHGRGACTTEGIFFLIRGFQQMHVHPHPVLLGILVQRLQRLIRAPVQIRWCQLDTAQFVAVPAFPEIAKNVQLLLV